MTNAQVTLQTDEASWPKHVGASPRPFVYVPIADYHDTVARFFDQGFEQCSDVMAVDYLSHPGRTLPEGIAPERFEVKCNLLSLSLSVRTILRVQVPELNPHIASVTDIYPGTEAMEREVYDLMGIIFVGHPDLTRILMPDEWEGHPLRKDYGVGRVPIQFKDAPGPR
jgi:NADH-quinone oxidoreductase subunit C